MGGYHPHVHDVWAAKYNVVSFPLTCRYRGWIIAPFHESIVNTWRILVTSGWTSISVLGQELYPPLVECQCMVEKADMFHPINRSREHPVVFNPDGRDRIPKTLIVSVQGSIKAEYVLHTRHWRNAIRSCSRLSKKNQSCLSKGTWGQDSTYMSWREGSG